jgi:UDP-glucose 4-epimerase
VVDALVAAGHDVAVIDDLSTGKRDYVNGQAQFHELDIRAPEADAVFAGFQPEALFHLAAQIIVTRSVDEPAYDAEINIIATLGLLDACVKHGVGKVVFSSTAGAIYGDAANPPATEETPPAPLSPYGAAKLAAEEYIRVYGRLHGLRHAILRYSNVYGPRQLRKGECGVVPVFTDQLLAGEPCTLYGYGEPVRDYVYVGDVAAANVAALGADEDVTVNICSGAPTTVREVFDALREITGADSVPEMKPLRPGEVRDSYMSPAKASARLGWRPETPFYEGLKAAVDFARRRQSQ